MKLSLLPALFLASASEGHEESPGDFGPYGMCSDSYPTLDLSEAFQPLQEPRQVMPDRDGVTRVKLVYNLVNYKGPSFNTILRQYNGATPGPTLRVEPGGMLELELINCLQLPLGFDGEEAHNRYRHPNSTNIHTHGPHVSGEKPGDFVFLNVGPQETFQYKYEFDENHMPGTFWYHPHLHGATALQTGQGAAGTIIMDHPEDYPIPDVIKEMPEIQMVFQHMDLNILRDAADVSQDDVTDWKDNNFEITNKTTDLTNFMLVNMQFLPKVTMEVHKWYRWRMVMSSVRSSLGFLSESGNCEFQLLAKDGIYLSDAPREVRDIMLAPGNRADVAVRCHELGLENMNITDLDLNGLYGKFNPGEQYTMDEDVPDINIPDLVGTFADPKLQPTIMVIDVVPRPSGKSRKLRKLQEAAPPIEPFTVPTPCYLVDLRNVSESEVEGPFLNAYVCENREEQERPWPATATSHDECGIHGPYGNPVWPAGKMIPFVNETTYINDFAVGTVQEVDHHLVRFHPYHQHINPYQIQKLFHFFSQQPPNISESVNLWYKVGDWHDTLQIPTAPNSNLTVAKVRFQADQFTGHMVQHCHLLFHEDQGMMAQYDITGEEGTTWSGARLIDPMCIKPSGPRKGKSGKSRSGKSGKNDDLNGHGEADYIEQISMSFDFLSMSMPVDDAPVFGRRQ